MSIKNTTKNEPIENLFVSAFGGGIEVQEAAGQKQLCNSSQLPKNLSCYEGDAKSTYEKIGIKVLKETDGDELFYDIELPISWKIEPTDHSMWSKLIDEKGNEIGAIFYKAAFYDRKAHFSLSKAKDGE